MTTIRKLQSMPYAQAHVERSCGDIYLFSYTTCVAAIVDGWLEVYGLYSATTRRHIGAFMREYVTWPNGEKGCYQDAKKLFENNFRMNVETGEVEEVS